MPSGRLRGGGGACQQEFDCGSGGCLSGVCACLPGGGSVCLSGADCCSGKCCLGTCCAVGYDCSATTGQCVPGAAG